MKWRNQLLALFCLIAFASAAFFISSIGSSRSRSGSSSLLVKVWRPGRRPMRKAAEKNNGEYTLAATVELDRALAIAQRYAGGKSAIVVCGDVGIGGLQRSA